MLRPSEIKWFYQHGASEIFPDLFERYCAPIPEEERGDLLQAFYRRLTSASKETRASAARAWSVWEGSTSKLLIDPTLQADFAEGAFADAFARIECHYFINGGFFPTDNWILENIQSIRHIPATVVHGRYDIVCPVRSAWDLHKSWPEAKLQITADAGHSAFEPANRTALLNATDEYALRARGRR
jgi:proline iminopeptidase